jgi:hypothetical protein
MYSAAPLKMLAVETLGSKDLYALQKENLGQQPAQVVSNYQNQKQQLQLQLKEKLGKQPAQVVSNYQTQKQQLQGYYQQKRLQQQLQQENFMSTFVPNPYPASINLSEFVPEADSEFVPEADSEFEPEADSEFVSEPESFQCMVATSTGKALAKKLFNEYFTESMVGVAQSSPYYEFVEKKQLYLPFVNQNIQSGNFKQSKDMNFQQDMHFRKENKPSANPANNNIKMGYPYQTMVHQTNNGPPDNHTKQWSTR